MGLRAALILRRRSTSVPNEAALWSNPGGGADDGDSAVTCLDGDAVDTGGTSAGVVMGGANTVGVEADGDGSEGKP